MIKKKILILVILFISAAVATVTFYLINHDVAVLNPQGTIAQKQRNLMLFACLLSLIVILPVYFLTFYITWKYRANNKKAKYSPNWSHSPLAESIWWGVPLVLILILSVVTWKSSHDLDPFKPLESSKKPFTVQVVALQWKWLFIYPEQNIATVNYLQFPNDTPINFKITADAPMNSFWIPELGGQVYAMAGMSTELHLSADRTGTYRGSSANLSGAGFSGMNFEAKSTTRTEFDMWAREVNSSSQQLDASKYAELAQASENNKPAFYSTPELGLYNKIIDKYMKPKSEETHAHTQAHGGHH